MKYCYLIMVFVFGSASITGCVITPTTDYEAGVLPRINGYIVD